MWVPVAVWQPCELLYTCYLLVTVGQWQVSVWKDKDLFPCGASGIHGTASFRSSASVWPTDSEGGPWMACTTALPQAAAYSSLYTDVWARHDGKKVCRQATNYMILLVCCQSVVTDRCFIAIFQRFLSFFVCQRWHEMLLTVCTSVLITLLINVCVLLCSWQIVVKILRQ